MTGLLIHVAWDCGALVINKIFEGTHEQARLAAARYCNQKHQVNHVVFLAHGSGISEVWTPGGIAATTGPLEF